MSINQDSSYNYKTEQTDIDLWEPNFDSYTEFGIRNLTGRTIFVMSGSGKVTKIPYVGSSRDESRNDNCVIINAIQKEKGMPDANRVYQDIDSTKNRTLETVTVWNKQLRRLNDSGEYLDTPRYVAQFGFVVAFVSDLNILKRAHPGFRNSVTEYVVNALKRIPEGTAGAAPLYIVANSHNRNINKIYAIINNTLCTVNVGHDLAADEAVDIYVFNGLEQVLKYRMLTSKGFVDLAEPDKNSFCIWGKDKDAVYKRLAEIKSKQAKLLTEAEVQDRITDALEEANVKIAQLEKNLGIERESKSSLAKECENYKKQISEINESAKQTHEQEMLRMKAEITKKENEARERQLEFEEKARQAEANAARAKESAERDKRDHEERMRRCEEEAARKKREDEERCRQYKEELHQAELREERAKNEHEDRIRDYNERLQRAKEDADREQRRHEERMREYEDRLQQVKLQAEQNKQESSNRDTKWSTFGTVAKTVAAVATAGISVYAAVHGYRSSLAQRRAEAVSGWLKSLATAASAACSIFLVWKKI